MKIPRLLFAMPFAALALFGCASPPTEQPAASAAPVASPAPAVKPQPRDVLKQMATYLRSLDRFTVRVEKTTELILPPTSLRLRPPVPVLSLTSGLDLTATVTGARYWQDEEPNTKWNH